MNEKIRIDVAPSEHVTAIVYPVSGRRVPLRLILAHGAGSNQLTPSMTRMASAFSGHGIETITFNFLYSEKKKRVPDKNDKSKRSGGASSRRSRRRTARSSSAANRWAAASLRRWPPPIHPASQGSSS